MTGFWIVSFIVLWVVVVVLGLAILAMAREIENLHTQLEAIRHYLSGHLKEKGSKEKPTNSYLATEETS